VTRFTAVVHTWFSEVLAGRGVCGVNLAASVVNHPVAGADNAIGHSSDE
jgi:hypothetical protein